MGFLPYLLWWWLNSLCLKFGHHLTWAFIYAFSKFCLFCHWFPLTICKNCLGFNRIAFIKVPEIVKGSIAYIIRNLFCLINNSTSVLNMTALCLFLKQLGIICIRHFCFIHLILRKSFQALALNVIKFSINILFRQGIIKINRIICCATVINAIWLTI